MLRQCKGVFGGVTYRTRGNAGKAAVLERTGLDVV
jgi:hypothetical protein